MRMISAPGRRVQCMVILLLAVLLTLGPVQASLALVEEVVPFPAELETLITANSIPYTQEVYGRAKDAAGFAALRKQVDERYAAYIQEIENQKTAVAADQIRYESEVEAIKQTVGQPDIYIPENNLALGDEKRATISNITVNGSDYIRYIGYLQYQDDQKIAEDTNTPHDQPYPEVLNAGRLVNNPGGASNSDLTRGARSDVVANINNGKPDKLAEDVKAHPYASGFAFAVKSGAKIVVTYALVDSAMVDQGVRYPIKKVIVEYTVEAINMYGFAPPWASLHIYRNPQYGAWLSEALRENIDHTKNALMTARYTFYDENDQQMALPEKSYFGLGSLNYLEAGRIPGATPFFYVGGALHTLHGWETATSRESLSYKPFIGDPNNEVDAEGYAIDEQGKIYASTGIRLSNGKVVRWDYFDGEYSYLAMVGYKIPDGSKEIFAYYRANEAGWMIVAPHVRLSSPVAPPMTFQPPQIKLYSIVLNETSYITVDGKILHPTEQGILPPRTFENYTLVETRDETNGDITHVYQPVTNPVPTASPTAVPTASPTAAPKTGDPGVQGYVLLASLSLLGMFAAGKRKKARPE